MTSKKSVCEGDNQELVQYVSMRSKFFLDLDALVFEKRVKPESLAPRGFSPGRKPDWEKTKNKLNHRLALMGAECSHH